MLNDLSSPLTLLETRRSGKPRDMVAPGPSAEETERMLRIATRVPDHGKLAPWRFVIIEDRDAFADLLARAYAAERPDAGKLEIKANDEFARQAPLLIVAISRPVAESRIPLREQRLSIGAAIFNLELAAIALGYVAGWLTGWAAYSPLVLEALGGTEGEEIAGFLFVGSPSKDLEERPRPELADVVSRWPAG
ncbi:nitroreductase family protein [Novosphingobium album (ex Liu et al. 2023)]|uniref:Putative NAD(P)H nitroreductase n=1 Tax=Novosphingobium album (ex Liu et al. 2023) TaxID=3031130 RepID=A0ABT5WX93_9SPHN|nr:nitroreductase [Novosphingobium album (ex Liu et al. 2023)]MDE8654525.1 nitroreductase [Novosphingobium album (ex Liu et al. 2023)]